MRGEIFINLNYVPLLDEMFAMEIILRMFNPWYLFLWCHKATFSNVSVLCVIFEVLQIKDNAKYLQGGLNNNDNKKTIDQGASCQRNLSGM